LTGNARVSAANLAAAPTVLTPIRVAIGERIVVAALIRLAARFSYVVSSSWLRRVRGGALMSRYAAVTSAVERPPFRSVS